MVAIRTLGGASFGLGTALVTGAFSDSIWWAAVPICAVVFGLGALLDEALRSRR